MHDTQVWFVIGVPILCLLAIGLDRLFAPRRGRFVARAPMDPRVVSARRMAPTAIDDPKPSGTDSDLSESESASASPAPESSEPDPSAPVLYDVSLEDPDPSDRASAPQPAPPTWRPGLPLRAPTDDGQPPSEATVRKRAWMAYATIASADEIGAENMARIERGRPPVRFNPLNSMLEAQQISVDAAGRSAIRWFDSDESVDPFALPDEHHSG